MTTAEDSCETARAPVIESVTELYDILCNATPHRELYEGQNGDWGITCDQRRVSTTAVQYLVRSGKVSSVYSTHPHIAFHVGRTIDMDRTLAARKTGLITKGDLLYVEDPEPRPCPRPFPKLGDGI